MNSFLGGKDDHELFLFMQAFFLNISALHPMFCCMEVWFIFNFSMYAEYYRVIYLYI